MKNIYFDFLLIHRMSSGAFQKRNPNHGSSVKGEWRQLCSRRGWHPM
jgi:hypothetical protein